MWHEVVLGREFFARLLAIDAEVASRTRAAGCGHCSGPLCVGDYDRKPRGGLLALAGEEAAFTRRYSFCCAREGCRLRTTPPSVRFLGRKIYLEGAILIACAVAAVEDRARSIRAATGIAARTVRRWHAWWRSTFAASALWVELRSRAPTLEVATLPGAMMALFEGSTTDDKLVLAMRFLAPLTSATAGRRSGSSRDAM